MRRYAHHKYTHESPFGTPRHSWSLIGVKGGVEFTAQKWKDADWVCGLEVHYRHPRDDDAPSHNYCWLLKCPCWHEGTSLYARETVWPRIEPMLKAGDHAGIFKALEYEADQYFYPKDEAE